MRDHSMKKVCQLWNKAYLSPRLSTYQPSHFEDIQQLLFLSMVTISLSSQKKKPGTHLTANMLAIPIIRETPTIPKHI